ncbi:conserved hypothetical protein [Ricinus communis]|uniref:Uncharacterized protein n=1 Tax=Ricinus communis TaxID=3988 RepID=B9RCN1_RICCO|nr:conserved hypothetical protein [Ricinus communis]
MPRHQSFTKPAIPHYITSLPFTVALPPPPPPLRPATPSPSLRSFLSPPAFS